MSYQVSIKIGSNWIDISSSVSSVVKEESLYSSLKPNTNRATFLLSKSVGSTVINYLLTSDNYTDVIIKKDNVDWFTGCINPKYKITETKRGINPFQIEVEDYTTSKLGKNITELISLNNKVVCNAGGTGIVNTLCTKAGITLASAIDIPTTIISYIVEADKNVTYLKALEDILLEVRYTFYFDASGKMVLYKLADYPDVTTITNVLKNDPYDKLSSNIKTSIEVNKSRIAYDEILIKYKSAEYVTGISLVSESCPITVNAGAYYPPESNTKTVLVDFKDVASNREIISCESATLSATYPNMTLYKTLQIKGVKGLFSIYNGTASAQSITKLDITGNCYIKKADNVARESITTATEKKTFTYDAKYITSDSDAKSLAVMFKNYYKACNISYSTISSDNYSIGSYIKLVDNFNLGFIGYGRIVSRKESDTGSYTYSIESIESYLPNPNANIEVSYTPIPPSSDLSDVPSYDDLQNGYTKGGGTTTPDVPLNISFVPGKYVIAIKVGTKQLNLTNFSHYEVQGSVDSSNWYSLKFDGTDWKDTLNAVTTFQDNILIHYLGQNPDVNGNPQAYTLKYRIRQVTKAGIYSAWHTPTSYVSSLLIDGNDIVAGSITADKLEANAISTSIANINNYVRIGDTGFTGQTYAVGTIPTIGDRRVYIDKDEVTKQNFSYNTSINFDISATTKSPFYINTSNNSKYVCINDKVYMLNSSEYVSGQGYKLKIDRASYSSTYSYEKDASYTIVEGTANDQIPSSDGTKPKLYLWNNKLCVIFRHFNGSAYTIQARLYNVDTNGISLYGTVDITTILPEMYSDDNSWKYTQIDSNRFVIATYRPSGTVGLVIIMLYIENNILKATSVGMGANYSAFSISNLCYNSNYPSGNLVIVGGDRVLKTNITGNTLTGSGFSNYVTDAFYYHPIPFDIFGNYYISFYNDANNKLCYRLSSYDGYGSNNLSIYTNGGFNQVLPMNSSVAKPFYLKDDTHVYLAIYDRMDGNVLNTHPYIKIVQMSFDVANKTAIINNIFTYDITQTGYTSENFSYIKIVPNDKTILVFNKDGSNSNNSVITPLGYTKVWTDGIVVGGETDLIKTTSIIATDIKVDSLKFNILGKRELYSNHFIVEPVGSQLYDPFILKLLSSGTCIKATSEGQPINYPGLIEIKSSTTANSGVSVQTPASCIYLHEGLSFAGICRFNESIASTTTFRIGLFNNSTYTEPTYGVYFKFVPPYIIGVCRKDASNFLNTSNFHVGSNYGSYHRFEIEVISLSSFRFKIYQQDLIKLKIENLVFDETLSYTLPEYRLGIGVIATSSGTTAKSLITLDYLGFQL